MKSEVSGSPKPVLKRKGRLLISLSLLLSLAAPPLSFVALPGGHPLMPMASASAEVARTPAIVEVKLPTGQNLYIKEDHSRPIVTIDTWVKTGSVNETGDNNGVSHFLEHLLFKGTEQYKAGQIDRILESRGAQFNAATSDDFTHYYITTAPNYFEEALKLHADMMTSAVLPPDELTKERKVVQEEINRANDNPSRQLYVELARRMYGTHGYALDTLGPKENIRDIPRENILNYYHHWYRPENFNTIIVGDIEAAKVKAMVEKAFPARTAADAGTYQPPAVSQVAWTAGPQSVVLKNPTINQAYIALAMPGPAQQDPDDVYALDLAMLALGTGKSSRLYRALKEEKPLATTISGSNYTQKYSGLVVVDAEVKPENRDAVKKEILRQLEKLRTDGITQQELQKAKTQYVKDFVFENETTDGTASAIGYNVTIGSLADYQEHVSRVEAVTPERIRAALNKYMDPGRAVFAEMLPVSVPMEANTENEKNIAALKAWGTRLDELKATETKALAQGELPKSVEKRNDAPAVQVTKTVLPNGLTLISKPVSDSSTIALKLFVKGGAGVEAKSGVASLVASLLTQGSRGRTAEDINRELESKGMGLTIAADDDFVVVSGTAIQEDWGELATVLQDVLTTPKFNAAEIAKKKVQMRQALLASRDNPSSVAFENLKLALYPNHPYGDTGKRVEVALHGVTRADLLAYYNRYFQPANMVVSIVGNFDPQAVANYFNALFPAPVVPPGSKAVVNKPAEPRPVPPLLSNKTVEERKAKLSAVWMAKGWLAPPIKDAQDYAALKVLNTLVGTGMSSRLFIDLREKQGLAYVVGSQYPSRKAASSFTMYIGTDPVNTDKVQQGFDQELERLKNEAVTDTELSEAKSKLIGAFALSHDNNANQANYLALYEGLGVGYQFDKTYPDLINKVTADDLRRVAQKYFSGPSVLSLVRPAKMPAASAKPSHSPAPSQNKGTDQGKDDPNSKQ